MKKEFSVGGMSCAACQASVEKAVKGLDGVEACSVSLLTNSMTVEGDVSSYSVVSAVEKAGYSAREKGKEERKAAFDTSELDDKETPVLKRRLFWSLGFLLILMYISMGHLMWSWPLFPALASNPMALALTELLLSTSILVINQRFFISGTKALIKRSPNMDTLVSLGSAASYIWSIVEIYEMTLMDKAASFHALHGLYLESAAMILVLITLGKMLEARSKGKTTDALRSLMALAAKEARVLREGKIVTVPSEDVVVGDIFLLKPGEAVPVDGIIVEGDGAYDESTLTGESLPVDKKEGDHVFASTINLSGAMKCKATKVGSDTTLSKIIEMVRSAGSSKAPIAKIADKVSGIFVPFVMTVSALTAVIWYFVTKDIGYSLERGISVLVISCPCALGLATPVAIMVGSGKGAKNGILYKTAAAMEELGRAETVILDKTGTITEGRPKVTAVIPNDGEGEEALLSFASSLEAKSEHPVALSIIEKAREKEVPFPEISAFRAIAGMGVEGEYEKKKRWGGKKDLASGKARLPHPLEEEAEKLEGEGNTVLWFGEEDRVKGIIAVSDSPRPDSMKAIGELKNMGLKVVMLTGDNERTASAIGLKIGVSEIHAGVLPDGKQKVVENEKKEGKTVMVGDGINDAVALKSADVGVAIGSGTDVAIDSADVVLVNGTLSDLASAIRLSRRTLRNIHQNLFWAFFYNSLGIPLAAGAFIPLFGLSMTPMFGALAMSLSSFCVVTNALRLNTVDVHDSSKDRAIMHRKKKNYKEKAKMKRTMHIEGMMCSHCEMRVKKALEAVSGVESAIVSHEKGSAEVTLSKEVPSSELKEAVEAQDYKVTSIE